MSEIEKSRTLAEWLQVFEKRWDEPAPPVDPSQVTWNYKIAQHQDPIGGNMVLRNEMVLTISAFPCGRGANIQPTKIYGCVSPISYLSANSLKCWSVIGTSGGTRNCILRKFSTLANSCAPGFIAAYNARFAKPPVNAKDLHRPLRVGEDLDDAFAWKEERTLSRAPTLQYDKVLFSLEPSEPAKAAIALAAGFRV